MRTRRTAPTERGAVSLEFGLIFPVILMMIFGIIQYGYLFWSLQTAEATARETARLLIVGSAADCSRDHALQHAANPAVGSTPPEVTWTYHAQDGTLLTAPQMGSLVTVTVRFQSLNIGLPFLPLPDGGMVEGTETARIENVPPAPISCDWTV